MTRIDGIEGGSSIYEALAEDLRRAISGGEYQPGQMLGSEHELARQRSISRMTVRRASEMLVNEGLLERRPGKGLFVRSQSVSVPLIELVAGNLSWDPSMKVARGLQAAARSKGFRVQLYDAQGNAELDIEVIRQLPDGPARGAVIVSFHSAALNEAIFDLKRQGYPFVLVDQRLHDIDVPSIMSDNYSGGMAATKELLAHGHRRVAFIGDLIAKTVQDRLLGMRDAMGDAGLVFDRSLVIDLKRGHERMGDWSACIEDAARELMKLPNPPTAIFCSCDAIARSVYRSLGAMGLQIPTDVSVMGFDDDPLAEWLTPALSTVRQPFEQMGAIALDTLCKRMEDSEIPCEQHVLPVELVRRQSVAVVKAG